MNNFNQDKQELEAKIKEKRAELDQVEANHRALRTRHGKEGQKLGELNANRKVCTRRECLVIALLIIDFSDTTAMRMRDKT